VSAPARTDGFELLPTLDENSLALYQWALTKGQLSTNELELAASELALDATALARAMAALTSHRLLHSEEGTGRRLPMSPEAATAALLGQAEEDVRDAEDRLRRRRERIDRLRGELTALSPLYLEARRGGTMSRSLDVLTDLHTVRDVITDVVAHSHYEVVACHPGGSRPEPALGDSVPRDLKLLARGVRIRSIYQHPARFHQPTVDYITKLTAAGSLVRTADQLAGQMLIVDGELAFVPHHGYQWGALVVREPSLVALLQSTFEQTWERAMPFRLDSTTTRAVSKQTKRTIAVLLARGLKDEVIAKRLGLSVRTCRRHISEFMEQIGASSRFQAGVLAGELGLTNPPQDSTA
jgi:DNA-binding CsgD family transcriptional regulator